MISRTHGFYAHPSASFAVSAPGALISDPRSAMFALWLE